jgi:hypothetical protein
MRTLPFTGLLFVFVLAGFSEAGAGAKPEHEPGTSVEMPYLIAPVIVDGQLFANAYVSSTIVAVSPAATIIVRDKLAFIQDAYVRDVNAAPIGKAADPRTVDIPALTARLLADARRVIGASYIDSVVIVRVQISPMHEGAAPS